MLVKSIQTVVISNRRGVAGVQVLSMLRATCTYLAVQLQLSIGRKGVFNKLKVD